MTAADNVPPDTDARPIRIGVSACLLGDQVRFDGGHKRDGFLVGTFGRFVEWVRVCPEVEMGLGVPRPSMRLERRGDGVHLVTPATGDDHTVTMQRYANRRVAALAADDLCGYILKKNSPSCGMERVKVYGVGKGVAGSGRGLFAEALLNRFPHLPIEEEGRLCDPQLRENFVERVFAYHRLRRLFGARWSLAELMTFHARHKLQLLAHSPQAYTRLGQFVASAKSQARAAVRSRYEAEFMEALARLATPKRHVNVLQHIAGYFKKHIDSASRRELQSLIEEYGKGCVPLVVPITLVRHYVRQLQIPYLHQQVYLDPHPRELMLRNHV